MQLHKTTILVVFLSLILLSLTQASIEYNVNAHGDAFTGSSSPTSINGLEIYMNRTTVIRNITKDAGSGATKCYLYNSSKDNTHNGTFVGNTCPLWAPVIENQKYYVMVDDAGDAYTRTDTSAPASFNYSAHDLWFTDSCYGWTAVSKGCEGAEIYDIASVTTGDLLNISLISPEDTTTLKPIVPYNSSATTEVYNFNITNATFFVWFSNGSLFNKTTNQTFNSTNGTYVEFADLEINNYIWNTKFCGDSPSGYYCRFTDKNYTFNIGSDRISNTYNSTTYETESETFTLKITPYVSVTPTDAYLNYDGTNYTATITDLGDGNYTISRTLDIPIGIGANNFYYVWSVNETYEVTPTNTQTVYGTYFTLCNTTYTTQYLNFTAEDETNSTQLNFTIPSSTFTYWLGSGSVNKTYSLTNNTANSNYTFCFSPQNRTANIYYDLSYTTTGYQQRNVKATEEFTNSTTNKPLYLLSTADGLYVTFQVLNAAEQAIENVYVTANTSVGGSSTIVGSGYTDSSGGITFWLNPNAAHQFSFSKSGYFNYDTTITPTQSSYTIQLTTTGGDTITDYCVQGISRTIQPAEATVKNATVTQFNLTISSSYWTLEEYGFILKNSTDTLGSGSGTTETGGTVNVEINTTSSAVITMEYYHVVNGTYCNGTRQWLVYSEAGTEWSLLQWFTDLSTYLDSGMFGLDNFGLVVISFVFIFCFAGLISYRFGTSSPAIIMTVIFGLVYLFEVVFGILTLWEGVPIGTIVTFLLSIAMIFREVSK